MDKDLLAPTQTQSRRNCHFSYTKLQRHVQVYLKKIEQRVTRNSVEGRLYGNKHCAKIMDQKSVSVVCIYVVQLRLLKANSHGEICSNM